MDLLYFIRWLWNKWEVWQKTYVFAILLMGGVYFLDGVWAKILATLSMLVVLFWLLKWFVYDQLVSSYKDYREEKNRLFNIIKDPSK